jgi:hypothetical protein
LSLSSSPPPQLVTLGDSSEAAKILEDKVNAIADRFGVITEVDLLSGDQEPNPLFPILFAVFTAALVVVLVVSCLRERRAEAVDGARKVFVHLGRLEKPAVIGGTE